MVMPSGRSTSSIAERSALEASFRRYPSDVSRSMPPGIGAAIWLHASDVQAIHDALAATGHTIVADPIDGPFGRTFRFADPDGYRTTLHDRA